MNLMQEIGTKMEKTLVQAMINEIVVGFEVYEAKYCKEPSIKKEVIDLIITYFTQKKQAMEDEEKPKVEPISSAPSAEPVVAAN